jgi:acyl-CoA hydrolase
LVEATGRVVRVGNSSLDVEIKLVAEVPVSGERRLCTRGRFTLVAVKGAGHASTLTAARARAAVGRE